ncbi:hypothetical protein [Halovenus sp. HT40]|uniref:hypothetical protein n=1 Tax=Halovenus sp. HT40 TaxID=3126691 RepID=UPI00300E984F
MSDDDDLRFGDVSGGSSGTNEGSSGGFDPMPLAVAGVVIVILLVGQPITTDIGGLSMNIVGALIVGVGGILGALGM